MPRKQNNKLMMATMLDAIGKSLTGAGQMAAQIQAGKAANASAEANAQQDAIKEKRAAEDEKRKEYKHIFLKIKNVNEYGGKHPVTGEVVDPANSIEGRRKVKDKQSDVLYNLKVQKLKNDLIPKGKALPVDAIKNLTGIEEILQGLDDLTKYTAEDDIEKNFGWGPKLESMEWVGGFLGRIREKMGNDELLNEHSRLNSIYSDIQIVKRGAAKAVEQDRLSSPDWDFFDENMIDLGDLPKTVLKKMENLKNFFRARKEAARLVLKQSGVDEQFLPAPMLDQKGPTDRETLQRYRRYKELLEKKNKGKE